MANALPPLSSTVSSIFDAFVKKLEDEKVLSTEALKALKQSLKSQKLDHTSLREAMFTASEAEK